MSDRYASLDGEIGEIGEIGLKQRTFDAGEAAAESVAESAPYETFARTG